MSRWGLVGWLLAAVLALAYLSEADQRRREAQALDVLSAHLTHALERERLAAELAALQRRVDQIEFMGMAFLGR